jgi:hypothetical protein
MKLCPSDFNRLYFFDYFKRHPQEFQHHSLHDAKANMFAYRPRDDPKKVIP